MNDFSCNDYAHEHEQRKKRNTVDSQQIFARILFLQIALKCIYAMLKISRLRHDLPIYDLVISREFYLQETSNMGSFGIINPRENLRVYSKYQQMVE